MVPATATYQSFFPGPWVSSRSWYQDLSSPLDVDTRPLLALLWELLTIFNQKKKKKKEMDKNSCSANQQMSPK